MKIAQEYINKNESLKELLQYIDNISDSIGLGLRDYASLHATIKRLKPKIVLECGTGKSTLIIAQAMLDNNQNSQANGLKLISMEQDKRWHEIAVSVLPDKYKDFVEIHYSPVDIYGHAFLQGTVYKEIPEYPYEFVFIDGPKQEINEKKNLCNMDFIRLVEKSDTPISAFIDNRKNSVMAYSLLFGPQKVKYYNVWGHGIIENVTKDDFVLDDTRKKKIIWPLFVQRTYAKPKGL